MKVLAIDPGFGRCGVAVLDGTASQAALLHSSCIETDTKSVFASRLKTVAEEIVRLIETYAPEIVALEELYFSNNQKTALRVAEVRGMLIYLAVSHDLPLVEFNPLAVKTALTGYGKANKEQVMKMVERLITIPKKKMLDDEYDAIALGLTALAESRHRELRTS